MSTTRDDIEHYQKKLLKYSSDPKIALHCLSKLAKLPIGVQHLQETGIGRTVNGMRKTDGAVGEKARSLVNKWKLMVQAEDDKSESGDEDVQYEELEPLAASEDEAIDRHRSPKKHKESKHREVPAKDSAKIRSEASTSRSRSESKSESSKSSSDKKSVKSEKSSQKSAKKDKRCKSPTASTSRSATKRAHSSDDDDNADADDGGLSFADALGSLDTKNKKKKSKDKEKPKKLDMVAAPTFTAPAPAAPFTQASRPAPTIDIRSSDFEISPHYKPLPHSYAPDSPPQLKGKRVSDEEALSVALALKGSRTKVFSGKASSGLTHVPSLFEFCIRTLQDNIEALEYTGGVPYDLLRPVLERASAQQLYSLEHFNPYLLDDTDELWRILCQKECRKGSREEMESWRDMYLRCHEEREARLKSLTANIQRSMAKATPVRTTKLAYVESVAKPSRSAAKSQLKQGAASAVYASMTKAKASTRPFEASSHHSSSAASAPEAVKIHASSAAARSSSSSSSSAPSAAKKPKVAPLMQKTLKFIKNRYRR
nr:EOG090X0BTZ [Leptodora kindtii]